MQAGCHIYNSAPGDLNLVAELLRAGKLAALPTETVYGLAGDALNVASVKQIFAVKGRPFIDPLIVHVRDLLHAEELAEVNDRARLLAHAFWPGPLTIVLPRKAIVSDWVTASQSTVALRSPSHPVFKKLLELTGLALAAPSANPFGYISPTRAAHVQKILGDRIECIVDGGACHHGVESTIVDLSSDQVCILRPGPIGVDAIAAVLGEPVTPVKRSPRGQTEAQLAPGMLIRHYSPRTPAHLVDTFPEGKGSSSAWVFLKHPSVSELESAILAGAQAFWLSESGDVAEMMQNVYDLLHNLDSGGFSAIFVQRPSARLPGSEALIDRLTRACC